MFCKSQASKFTECGCYTKGVWQPSTFTHATRFLALEKTNLLPRRAQLGCFIFQCYIPVTILLQLYMSVLL